MKLEETIEVLEQAKGNVEAIIRSLKTIESLKEQNCKSEKKSKE